MSPRMPVDREIVRQRINEMIREALTDTERKALDEVEEMREDRDRYWQALVDIAGLENWQSKAAGDIARDALAFPRKDENDG